MAPDPRAPAAGGEAPNPALANFKPYISPNESPPELTAAPLIVGALLGLVFAASSVYLGLKVGLTVSASIPVAVMSITVFRWLSKALRVRKSTILENNIAQTTGSAGESIAAGVAFTLPSLLLMGFDMDLPRILLVALLGGLIGVLMMIPLRQGLIVKEHGKLTYPEGTACADVLVVGEQGGTNARTVFIGFFVGLTYAFLNLIAKLWSDAASFKTEFMGRLKGATLAFEVSPPMLGVGYIIGPKVAANMVAGGALAFMILVPLIHLFGDSMLTPMYPATVLIRDMSPYQIRNAYILYIGAGAVATGGFIALARAIPSIISAFSGGLKSLKAGRAGAKVEAVPRTQRDLPMTVVLGGAICIALAIAVAPPLQVNPVSAILIILFGFFFVTVSSRITGEIGSSSNPISGMTVATLLITCGLFVAVGWVGVEYKAMALTTAALVCVAASNGGTISQDLKTGFLVGATPRHQQVSILVGVITSAILIGVTLQILNRGSTTPKAVDYGEYSLGVAQDAAKVTFPADGQPAEVVPVVFAAMRAEYNRVQKAISSEVTAQTELGPDQKSYRVAFVRDDLPLDLEQATPANDPELAGQAQAASEAILAGKFSDALAIVAKLSGGKQGRFLPRGKYLIDEAGRPMYLVDPGVCGTYPYRLDKWAGPATTLAAIPDKVIDAGPDLGTDRKPYRAFDVKEKQGAIEPGRYLVDEGGAIVYSARTLTKFDAPKAQLFRLIIDGTLGGKLPWGLVLVGVFLAIMMELVGVSSLPFAVGLYLPISTSAGIFVGGICRWIVDRRRKGEAAAEAEFSPGMLMASGLIAGGAIAGVAQAIIAFYEKDSIFDVSPFLGKLAHDEGPWPMAMFLLMAASLVYVGLKKQDHTPAAPVAPPAEPPKA